MLGYDFQNMKMLNIYMILQMMIDRYFIKEKLKRKIKEKLISGVLRIDHVTFNEQVADVFIKGLSNKAYHVLVCKLGMCDIYAPT